MKRGGGGYKEWDIFFSLYNGVSVPWMINVNNFRLFATIAGTMLPTKMHYISLVRSFYSASACAVALKSIEK